MTSESHPQQPPGEPGDDYQQQVPARVKMALLDLVTAQALEGEYQAVADQGVTQPHHSRRRQIWVSLSVAAMGFLIVVSLLQTTKDAEASELGRSTLISQLNEKRADLRETQSEVGGIQRAIAETDNEHGERLATLKRLQQRTSNLGTLSGYTPVTGPGVTAFVDNPAGATRTSQIRDSDLALLVDGFWNAGAEAIEINGQRLTALSAIRNVGATVTVQGQRLSPPYTVVVIGDNRALQANFSNSTSGLRWYDLVQAQGFSFEMDNAEGLRVVGSKVPNLRVATTVKERE